MKRFFTILLAVTLMSAGVTAQERSASNPEEVEKRLETLENEVSKLKKFKVSGYIQGQFQWGEEEASLKVGSGNSNPEKPFNRIGIRRGRIKFTYESGLVSGVFQLDVTDKEKSVGFKDVYLNIKDPWFKSMSFRAGIFDRPFGFEIGYSSSRRESPERSTIFQTLFPDERDLGAMLVLQAPKSSPWSILKFEAGLFAGNGINKEIDNRRDFIGHLSASKKWDGISLGGGFSYYNGSVYHGTQNVYKMSDGEFVLNDNEANKGRFSKREYFGFDMQFDVKSVLGLTQLRGEYLFGQQPGSQDNSKSPNSSSLPVKDTYVRDFRGGYAMLVQRIGKAPVSVVLKYDWYDPNTKVSKDEVGLNAGTGKADISQSTFGFGALWDIIPSVRLTAYYDLNRNEKSDNLDGYGRILKKDIFTLRLQYKF